MAVLLTGGTGSFGQETAQTVLRDNRTDRIAAFSRNDFLSATTHEETTAAIPEATTHRTPAITVIVCCAMR